MKELKESLKDYCANNDWCKAESCKGCKDFHDIEEEEDDKDITESMKDLEKDLLKRKQELNGVFILKQWTAWLQSTTMLYYLKTGYDMNQATMKLIEITNSLKGRMK